MSFKSTFLWRVIGATSDTVCTTKIKYSIIYGNKSQLFNIKVNQSFSCI